MKTHTGVTVGAIGLVLSVAGACAGDPEDPIPEHDDSFISMTNVWDFQLLEGDQAIVLTRDRELREVDLDRGEVLGSWSLAEEEGPERLLLEVARPSGLVVTTALREVGENGGGALAVLEWKDKNIVNVLEAEAEIVALAGSADGRHVAVADEEGNVAAWNVETGEPLWSVRAFERAAYSLGFVDDHVIAFGMHQSVLVMKRIKDGESEAEQEVRLLRGPPVRVAARNQEVYVGGLDNVVRYDPLTQDWEEVYRAPGRREVIVTAITTTEDGLLVATWNVVHGRGEVFLLQAPGGVRLIGTYERPVGRMQLIEDGRVATLVEEKGLGILQY